MYKAFVRLFLIYFSLPVMVFVTSLASFGHNNVAHATTIKRNPQSTFSRRDALTDPNSRIIKEFSIPKGLEERTAFWFDVYTLYGSNEHIVHHILYPWIVYKVIDTNPIYATKAHKWTKYHRAERHVKNETRSIRLALNKLAKRSSYKNLSPMESQLAAALSSIPGSRKRVYIEAARNVRVQLGQKDFFVAGLAYSARYLPVIEDVFRNSGLPTELTRLPFVESSFNVKAHSKVGASGIWQIMPYTGKPYLHINNQIDERNSPLKASLVAADLFKRNFKVLKDWPLAVTAYNHGAAGVKNSLRKSRTTNLPDLVEQYHEGSFRFASANFYTSFLAALHAEKYHQEIFPGFSHDNEKIEHRVLSLQKPSRIKPLAQRLGISHDILLEYNLDLKNAIASNGLLPKGYKLIVPSSIMKIRTNPGLKEAVLTLRSRTAS